MMRGDAMDMSKIRESITRIIELMEKKIETEENPEKLALLKKKYEIAYEKLGKNMDISADLSGTVRMYLESYSDYTDNPLLEDMGKAEQLVKDLAKEQSRATDKITLSVQKSGKLFTCKKCGCEVVISKRSLSNAIVICPKCYKYISSVSDYGHGPIAPCDVYVGEKIVGQIKEAPASDSYRFLSPELNVAFSLKSGYKDLGCYKEVAGFIENYLNEKESRMSPENKNETTFDEKILTYKMNSRDEQLANIALLIIEAYNGSYKPHLFDEIAFHNSENYYDIKHTDEGYSLIFTKAEKRNPSHKRIATTDEHINDFVEHIFLILTGDTSVKWTKIVNTSAAVKNALNKHYGMEVELSNVGYDHKFDMFGIPELPIKPTIWAKRKIDDTAFKEMEEKGFCYYDRDLWVITL